MSSVITSLKQAEVIAGALGAPSKMPGYAYGLSARDCKVGGVLRQIKGSVCSKCYAMKGHYNNANVVASHAKRKAGLQHPLWVDALVFMIKYRVSPHFRWHDSGDLQSLEHLEKIVEVCNQTPGTKHWLPTREAGIVNEYLKAHGDFPENLCVRVSGTMIDGPPPADFNQTSTVVTKDWTCPSSQQQNTCSECRMCWDRNVKNVAYKRH